jgi:uncharacterized membrane protein YgdD (TMEM256/DUF423 family)
MERLFFVLGSGAAVLAVAAGAFGGHLLKQRLDADLFEIFEVSARYHMYHALALLATAWACSRWPGPWSTAAGWFFAAGLVLFCGSLYTLSLTGVRFLGAVTPLGGLAFMAGWLCLALGARKA